MWLHRHLLLEKTQLLLQFNFIASKKLEKAGFKKTGYWKVFE